MVKEARHLIRSRKLGRIAKSSSSTRKVGCLSVWPPPANSKSGARTPNRAASAVASRTSAPTPKTCRIRYGSQNYRTCRPMLRPSWIAWTTTSTSCSVLENNAKGVLHASQICVGEENNLNIRVWGELGGLEWHQTEPNTLLLKWPDRTRRTLPCGHSLSWSGSPLLRPTLQPAIPKVSSSLREHLPQFRQSHSRSSGRTKAARRRSRAGLSED